MLQEKNNDNESENNENETNNKRAQKRKQSKKTEYTKRDEQHIIADLLIPHEIMIPTAKRQRKNNVSSDSVLDTSKKKETQDDIPLVIDLREVPQPDLNRNDDAGNEIIRSSGGIKESHEIRFPTKTSTYR